jgi:hypothetical protein
VIVDEVTAYGSRRAPRFLIINVPMENTMKFSPRMSATALFVIAVCAPAIGNAQAPAQGSQQEVRFVTVSKFALPHDTTQQRLVMMAIDSIMVPQARMDPNVLSYRVLTHNWGADSNDILIVAEYQNWAAIEAPCAACDAWLQSKTPAAGTPERGRWDAMGAAFQTAYRGHSDEIYSAQMRRAKR